jgi:hypothetical protein
MGGHEAIKKCKNRAKLSVHFLGVMRDSNNTNFSTLLKSISIDPGIESHAKQRSTLRVTVLPPTSELACQVRATATATHAWDLGTRKKTDSHEISASMRVCGTPPLGLRIC